jgi:hypothetical protein
VLRREHRRCLVAQAAVRPLFVVLVQVQPGDQLLLLAGVGLRLITLRAAGLAQNPASPTLRNGYSLLHVLDRLPPPRRAQ